MGPETTGALRELHTALQRYAGWLDRERASLLVKADVKALGAAIDTCGDLSLHLQALDVDIARLQSPELRKMLRTVAGQMRRTVESRTD